MSGWRWMWADRIHTRQIAARESLAMVAFPKDESVSHRTQRRRAKAWRRRAHRGHASAILADETDRALDTQNGQAIMTLLGQIAKDHLAGCWSSPTIPYPPFAQSHRAHLKMAGSSVMSPGSPSEEHKIVRKSPSTAKNRSAERLDHRRDQELSSHLLFFAGLGS